jgi:hypothetical protein
MTDAPEPAGLSRPNSAAGKLQRILLRLLREHERALRRQEAKARQPFGMHLLAAGTGIRKTLFPAPFENPINTRVGLSLIWHTEIN